MLLNQSLPVCIERNDLRRGYTIVEVLVVIAISVIVVTFSYANIRDFQARQKLTNIARQLDADLNYAQQAALAGYKPDDVHCTGANSTFESIRLLVDSDAKTYRFFPRCSGGNAADLIFRTLPSDVTLYISRNNLDFYPLTGGTSATAGNPVSVGVCGFGVAKGFTVTSTGEVSQNATFTCP